MRLIDADALKTKQQEDADLFIGDDTLSGKSRRDEALNAVANIVNAQTVDPVKHGRWLDRFVVPITCTSDIEAVQNAKCSNCRRWHERPYWLGGFTDYTYCPWCGTKMDEVEE